MLPKLVSFKTLFMWTHTQILLNVLPPVVLPSETKAIMNI